MARGFLALYGAGPSARMRALLGFCSQTSNMGRQLVLQCWASARIPTKASRCADGFGPHGLEEPPGEIDDDGEPGQDLVEGRRTAARSTCCRRWPEQEDQEGAFYRVARVWGQSVCRSRRRRQRTRRRRSFTGWDLTLRVQFPWTRRSPGALHGVLASYMTSI